MSELITIQVGQCGNQIGSTFWPLVLQEYGINNVPTGIQRMNTKKSSHLSTNDSFHSFFTTNDKFTLNNSLKYSDLKNYNVKARSILIDMEDSVVDRFHTGPLRNLFSKSCIVKNYPGSGNNWAEGYFTHGAAYRHKIENTIRRAVENCHSLLGFLFIYSVGGGTGSGLGSQVLELLDELYPNVERFVTCIYPNGTEDVITCPYNSILATKYLTEHATCIFPVENRALIDIVNKQNEKKCRETLNYNAQCNPFQDMNTIVVNMLLNLTSGSRFSGSLNVDMSDLSTNLIPYPNMHFISSSVSPITVSVDQLKRHGTSSSKIYSDIFNECCDKKNQLIKLNPFGGNSILVGATFIGRGNFKISHMRSYVDQLQTKSNFTQWSKTAIKIGLCDVPPAGHDVSMLSLFNTTAMVTFFQDIVQKFNKLYNKKAHVHHYKRVENFEMQLFDESKECLLNNIENYRSLNNVPDINRSRYFVL